MLKAFFFLSVLICTHLVGASSGPHFQLFEGHNCKATKNYQFLTTADKEKLEKKLGHFLSSKTIRRLDVNCKGKYSHAYILSDKIRTHHQALLVWVAKGLVKDIEVLEFTEPKRYQAPKKWIHSILGRNEKTILAVDGLSGATLTRQSTLKLVKEALYLEHDKN